jgi:hypothetical protein
VKYRISLRRSQGGSVGTGTGYGLDGRGLIPGREKRFFLLHSVQNGSGAQSASYPMDTGCSFPGGEPTGREADHSPPSSADVKNGGVITSLPHMSPWPGA